VPLDDKTLHDIGWNKLSTGDSVFLHLPVDLLRRRSVPFMTYLAYGVRTYLDPAFLLVKKGIHMVIAYLGSGFIS